MKRNKLMFSSHLSKLLLIIILSIIFVAPRVLAIEIDQMDRSDLYQLVGNFCMEDQPLAEERCHEAFIAKAWIDTKFNQGWTPEEVLAKISQKYSPRNILDKKCREKSIHQATYFSSPASPRLYTESRQLRFEPMTKSQQSVRGEVLIKNQGVVDLVIRDLKTSADWIAVRLKSQGEISPAFRSSGSPGNWRGVIPGLSEASLLIDFDVFHPRVSLGSFLESLFIYSNDPAFPLYRITIESEIILDTSFQPRIPFSD